MRPITDENAIANPRSGHSDSTSETSLIEPPKSNFKRRFAKWEMVGWLFAAYFLHQADKQVYSVVLKPMQADLHLSSFHAGLVVTIFSLVVACMSPIAGAIGDRWQRHRIIYMTLLIWSLATAATGLASGMLVLVVARSLITAGAESFYPPVSHAYLANWHDRTRAVAISIHQVAQYAGPIASGFVAAEIAERYGWRYSFWSFGIIGALIALCMAWRLQPDGESRPGNRSPGETREPLFAGFVVCMRMKPVQQIGLAFACVLFVSIGYGTWAPSLFAERFGLSLTQAGFQTSLWISVSAMFGAVVGGYLSDFLASRGHSRFLLQSAVLMAASPFVWLLGSAGSLNLALLALACLGVFKGVYEGTLAVSLYDHVDARYRSSAAAVVLLLSNLLAAPSGAILGFIKDHWDINTAISWLAILFVIASIVLFRARRYRALGNN